MSRLLNTLGLFLGLCTFASLVGMFVDGENITFWATGFGVGMTLLLFWAPIYLYIHARNVKGQDTEQASASSPMLAWFGIIPIAALALFLFSVMQVIVGNGTPTWINTGIGAFIVAVIAAPTLILLRGIQAQRSTPAPEPESVEPFVEDQALPFSLSDLPTAPADDEPDDLGWPYTTSDEFSIEDEEGTDADEERVVR